MNTNLKINKNYLAIVLIAMFIISCNKDDNPGNTNQNTDPVITGTGTPVGTKTTEIVGASGGTVSSADGNLSLIIPAGALSGETEVSIQPVTNEAPLGLGNGYRLEPEGTKFNTPVQLVFNYNDDLLDGTPEDFLWIVTQAGDGSWEAALRSKVDVIAKTVTFEASHFSDWALGKFIDFSLTPSSKTILKEQSVQLVLSGFSRDKETTDDDELVPLIPITGDEDELVPLTPIPPIESRLMDFRVKQWTLNGAAAPVSNTNGKLNASGTTATYTAPNKVPTVNPVAVTVELESNNKEGKKASYMVTSSISVVESNFYLLVELKGQKYEYYQYGFDGTIPPDPNNFSIANCGLTDGLLGIAATQMANGSDFVNGFALEFKNPSVTSRRLSGYNEEGEDDITFLFYPSKAYMLDYTEYTYDADHDICNYEYKCSDITVTIIDYYTDTHIIRGYFEGEIYDETTNENWNNCKTAEKHKIYGEFNLYVVNM
jgi:hypothetical protein